MEPAGTDNMAGAQARRKRPATRLAPTVATTLPAPESVGRAPLDGLVEAEVLPPLALWVALVSASALSSDQQSVRSD